jgi:hypothetical protein
VAASGCKPAGHRMVVQGKKISVSLLLLSDGAFNAVHMLIGLI